jgi:predicted RNA-binding protein with RPS1 domain
MRLFSPGGYDGSRGIHLYGKKLDSASFGDKTIRVGDKIRGRVTNITHFGVFVDIGVEKHGLLPKKELEKHGLADVRHGREINVEVYRIRDEVGKGILIDLRVAEAGKEQSQEKVDAIKFGDRIVRVGDEIEARVANTISTGVFVDIGVEKPGFVSLRGLELKKGERVRVKISHLRIDKKRGPLIFLKLKQIVVKEEIGLSLPREFPPAERGIVWGELEGPEGGFKIEVPGEKKMLDLPARLTLGLNRGLKIPIDILRTGVWGPSQKFEICCELDFVPVAEKLLETISAKRKLEASGYSIDLNRIDTGREMPAGHFAFFVSAFDPVLEDVDYLYRGVLVTQDPSGIRQRIDNGRFYFSLAMEKVQPDWTALDLVRAMSKKPLLAEPA